MSVLFQQDWADAAGRPKALIHQNTTNHSFRRMVILLKKMGIKNCYFPLSLYDPVLLDVDPYALNSDNDASGELRLRVAIEARRNVWYALREIIRIPASGSDPIPFQLSRGNMAMSWCFVNNIDYTGTQPRQTGKALSLDAQIKTPSGWTRMGNIRQGDQVTAPDGTTTTVVGVYPQGEVPLFRVTFDDGRSVDCCQDHLWKVSSDNGKHSDVVDTQYLIRELQSGKASYSVPLVHPEDKPDVRLPINPYTLGYNFGLLCRGRKFTQTISPEYVNASPKQVQSFLQGLFDSKGDLDKKGRIRFWSSCQKFSEQIQYMVRSIGGTAAFKVDRISEHHHSYALKIEYQNPHQLFLHSPKRRLAQQLYPFYALRLGIKSIEPVGTGHAQCIEVDHPEHLFITNNFIVTHNTIGAIALTCWVIYISGYAMKMAMLTKDAKLVQENVSRLKAMRDALPPYLFHSSIDDTDNKQGLSYTRLRTEYLTFIGRSDKQAANSVGRGGTFPSGHMDEIGFIKNIRITFPNFMATTNKARENAKNAGQRHSMLYTTTAADPSTDSGQFAYSIVTKAMPFTEKLYDCLDNDDAIKMVKKNSENGVVNGTFSYLQLGYTHEWFQDTIKRNEVPPDEVERDYLNHWISLANNPILPKHVLSMMNQYRKDEALYKEVVDDFVISWYVPHSVATSQVYRRRAFVMGMDSSENLGRDFTTFVCVDPKDLSVVFTFRCNDSNTTKIGMLVGRLLQEFPRMLFIPERKSTGLPITDTASIMLAQKGIQPFTRIFNKVVDNKELIEFRDVNLHDPKLIDSAMRKHLGFVTTGTARNLLYRQILQRAARIAADRIYDPVLILEMSGLQVENGRIDHKTGRHDDMVIAFLLACYAVFEGKNLHLYGINSDDVLKVTTEGEVDTMDPQYIQQQLTLRQEILELTGQMRQQQSEYIRRQLYHRLQQMQQRLDPNVRLDPVSVDAVRKDQHQFGDVYAPPQLEPKKATYQQQELQNHAMMHYWKSVL